jgi:hypothetical protein
LTKNGERLFDCSPRVRYKPQCFLVGKFYSYYNTLHLESQRVGTLLSVITRLSETSSAKFLIMLQHCM